MALRDRLGFAVLFITHDLSLLVEIADSIAVMYAGRLVERARRARRSSARRGTRTRSGLLSSFPALHGPRGHMDRHPGLAARPARHCRRLPVPPALRLRARPVPHRSRRRCSTWTARHPGRAACWLQDGAATLAGRAGPAAGPPRTTLADAAADGRPVMTVSPDRPGPPPASGAAGARGPRPDQALPGARRRRPAPRGAVVHAVEDVSLALPRGRHHRGGRRERLGQVDAGPAAGPADQADRRASVLLDGAGPAPGQAALRPRRCSWCCRTRSPRSTRCTTSATTWPGRCGSTGSASGPDLDDADRRACWSGWR